MKKAAFLIPIVLLTVRAWCIPADTAGTIKPKPSSDGSFFGKFHLRQSFQTADGQQSPAEIQLTIPQTGRANWLFDAGASLALKRLSEGPFITSLTGEFHRNTQITTQQYNYQAGFNFIWNKHNTDGSASLVWSDNLKYIRDVIDSANSIAATFNFSLYKGGIGKWNFGRPAYLDSEKYTYQLGPYAEVQYQQFFASGAKMSGAIIRPMIDISASLARNRKKKGTKVARPPKLVEIAFDYVNRYAVVNGTGNNEGFTKLFKTGINYYLLSTPGSSVALGINYNLGSDPLNGLKDQRFWQFALQVQL